MNTVVQIWPAGQSLTTKAYVVGQLQFCCVLPGSREPAHLSVRPASSRRRAAVRCARLRSVHRPLQLQVRSSSLLFALEMNKLRGPAEAHSTFCFLLQTQSETDAWCPKEGER